MSIRSAYIIMLTDDEVARVSQIALDPKSTPAQVRHAYVLLTVNTGVSPRQAAEILGISCTTAYRVIDRFIKYGLDGAMTRIAKRYTPEMKRYIVKIASTAPVELGVDIDAWDAKSLLLYIYEHAENDGYIELATIPENKLAAICREFDIKIYQNPHTRVKISLSSDEFGALLYFVENHPDKKAEIQRAQALMLANSGKSAMAIGKKLDLSREHISDLVKSAKTNGITKTVLGYDAPQTLEELYLASKLDNDLDDAADASVSTAAPSASAAVEHPTAGVAAELDDKTTASSETDSEVERNATHDAAAPSAHEPAAPAEPAAHAPAAHAPAAPAASAAHAPAAHAPAAPAAPTVVTAGAAEEECAKDRARDSAKDRARDCSTIHSQDKTDEASIGKKKVERFSLLLDQSEQ